MIFVILLEISMGVCRNQPLDFVLAYVFHRFLLFAIFAFVAISELDVLKVFKLYLQPVVKLTRFSIFFTLVNLIALSPLIFITLYPVWAVLPPPLSLVASVYLLLLGLSAAATTMRVSVVSTVLSIAVALFSMSQFFITAATALALAVLTVRATTILLKEIPRVSILFSHMTVSPYIILMTVFITIAIALLSRHIEGYAITQTLFAIGIISTNGGSPHPILLMSFIMAFVFFIPLFLNLANRYVDAYIWYLRAIRGITLREKVMKTLFHISTSIAITTSLLLFLKHMGVVTKLEYILTFGALAAAIGNIHLVKIETGSGAIALSYLLVNIGLGYLFFRLMDHPSISPLFSHLTPPGLYTFDIVLTTMLIAVSIALYDLHIKIKMWELGSEDRKTAVLNIKKEL
ncbi:MAG: hypothetical protein ACK4SY_09090 [Pyrobaculum sp.]